MMLTHHLNIACSSEQITLVVADHTVQYLSHVLGSPGGHPCSPETPLDSLAHTPPPQPLHKSSIGIPSCAPYRGSQKCGLPLY